MAMGTSTAAPLTGGNRATRRAHARLQRKRGAGYTRNPARIKPKRGRRWWDTCLQTTVSNRKGRRR